LRCEALRARALVFLGTAISCLAGLSMQRAGWNSRDAGASRMSVQDPSGADTSLLVAFLAAVEPSRCCGTPATYPSGQRLSGRLPRQTSVQGAIKPLGLRPSPSNLVPLSAPISGKTKSLSIRKTSSGPAPEPFLVQSGVGSEGTLARNTTFDLNTYISLSTHPISV
jgi:hypothetical protein